MLVPRPVTFAQQITFLHIPRLNKCAMDLIYYLRQPDLQFGVQAQPISTIYPDLYLFF